MAQEEKEAEPAVDAEVGGEAPAPKKSKKKIIIIAAVVLAIIGGGAGAFFMMKKGGGEEKKEDAVELDEHGNPVSKTVYYTLPEFLVNLNSSGKSSVFLKTTVVLEVAKQADIPLIETALPKIVDSINTYLRELRSSDLAGSAGIQRLREEILLRINKAIAPTQINNVLFKEIVVQ